MRYLFVKEQAACHRVATLCRILAVSKSGYYAWRYRPPSRRSDENKGLTQKIATAFEQNRRAYGSPRIYTELRDEGILCSENRVARLMRKAGIRVEPVRKFRVTTDSGHGLPVAQNYLGRQFQAETQNTKWASDITYQESLMQVGAVCSMSGKGDCWDNVFTRA